MENRKAFLTLRFWSIWRQTTFKSVHTFDCLMGSQGKTAGIQSCYSKIKLNSLSQIITFETHIWSEFKDTTRWILWISKGFWAKHVPNNGKVFVAIPYFFKKMFCCCCCFLIFFWCFFVNAKQNLNQSL